MTPIQSHYLRLIRQEGDKYAMHKASADRAGDNDYLQSVADGQWRVLQSTIKDALKKFAVSHGRPYAGAVDADKLLALIDQPHGVAANNGISTRPIRQPQRQT